jgi:hypothetical protein
MRYLHCWQRQQSSILALFFACHPIMDTKTCYLIPGFASEYLLLNPLHSTWMACCQCWNNITSLTLSSVKQSWLCPTIKEINALDTLFESVSCKIFGQCVLCETLKKGKTDREN